MKRLYLFVVLPLLFAFQCEDDFVDAGFETAFLIQNLTDQELFYLDGNNRFIPLASQSEISIGSELNQETEAILPSVYLASGIRLYTSEGEDFILRYEQFPIDDGLWLYSEPLMNTFEYRLVIAPSNLSEL